jgi:hypothetical protein
MRDFSSDYLESKVQELCFKRENMDFDIKLAIHERAMEMQGKNKEEMKCSIIHDLIN